MTARALTVGEPLNLEGLSAMIDPDPGAALAALAWRRNLARAMRHDWNRPLEVFADPPERGIVRPGIIAFRPEYMLACGRPVVRIVANGGLDGAVARGAVVHFATIAGPRDAELWRFPSGGELAARAGDLATWWRR